MLSLIILRNVKENIGFGEFVRAELNAKHFAYLLGVNLGLKNNYNVSSDNFESCRKVTFKTR